MSTAANVVQNYAMTSPHDVVTVSCDSPQSLEAESPVSSDGVAPTLTAECVDDRLVHWKNTVKQNVRGSYYVVGQALHSVLHDEHLLNATSFIKWAQAHFGLTRSTAYEYIRAYKIVQMIRSQDPSMLVPTTLSHFRVFNKISLKDNGVKVFQLWKAILDSTPPENRHRLTAKEVLAKGKTILRNGTSSAHTMPTHRLHGGDFEIQESIPTSAFSQVVSSNKRRRPVREHARRAVGYFQAMHHDIDSEAHGDVDYNGAYADDNGDEQPMWETNSRTAHAGQAKRRNHPSRHVMSSSGNNRRGMANDHQHDQQYGRHVNGDNAVPSPEDAPPALIPMTMTPVRLAGLARRLVRTGFDVSVCPAETSHEARVIDAATTHMSDGYMKPWRGTVWGNFSGPRFDDHDELAVYVGAAMDKFNAGEYDSGVFVVNVAFFSSFFPKLLEYPYCFLWKPLESHLPGDSTNDDAIYHHQVIVAYFGSDASQFVQVMTNYGCIPGVNSWCNY